MLRFLGSLAIVAVVYFGVLWLALAYWALKDARSRSDNIGFHLFALCLNLLVPLLGLFIYLLVRPAMSLADRRAMELEAEVLAGPEPEVTVRPCPACGRQIERDYVLCPFCHTKFAKRCPNCAHAVRLGWTLCPFCATSLDIGAAPRIANQG